MISHVPGSWRLLVTINAWYLTMSPDWQLSPSPPSLRVSLAYLVDCSTPGAASTGWVLGADCIILDNTLVSTLRLVPATSRVSSDHAWMETPHTVTLPHITHHQTGTKIMNICRIGKPSSVYYSRFSFCETCFSNGSV